MPDLVREETTTDDHDESESNMKSVEEEELQ
jgi:hypothetical protein